MTALGIFYGKLIYVARLGDRSYNFNLLVFGYHGSFSHLMLFIEWNKSLEYHKLKIIFPLITYKLDMWKTIGKGQ